jgi:hypothetical protein
LLCVAGGAVAQSSGWVPRQDPGWRRPAEKGPSLPREIELRATGDGLDRIEAGYENVQDGRIRTEVVTDILVRLRPAVHQFRSGPGRDVPLPSDAERSYIEAQVLVVVGGRISSPALAQCRQFEGDVLVCAVECDGGVFGLRRGREPGQHHLLIGVSDPSADRDAGSSPARPGFKMRTCATSQANPTLLLPRGGRLAAEVRLAESRHTEQ